MSNKEKAKLLEFLLWLSGYLHINIDYIEVISKYSESKEMCDIMCGKGEK